MSIYEDIIRAQVKQGNMGGKKGPLGSYAKEKKKDKITSTKHHFEVTITGGKVYKSTDANGLCDPWVRVCKPGLLGKTLCHTDVQHKTLEPKWDYKGKFKVDISSDKNCAELIVEMLDKDMVGNDRVGIATIQVSQFGLSATTLKLRDPKDDKQINAEIQIEFRAAANNGVTSLDF
eukprot:Phypoly_transcript_18373.p1 GENE.Phypoly_transcript_18373~~Phypoly_transcript_18373.p1  ORF type:complete len:176 (+),score=37.56 Phypoly_transcript_18373:110-637(+)